MDLAELRKLVQQGEGTRLEFKRKANHPDKICRELVAFANSQGGILCVGVDDDETIYGVKYPDGDAFELTSYIENYCFPPLPYRLEKIPINSRRAVIALHVEESPRKPHFVKEQEDLTKKAAFVRVRDMSVRASREMVQILRLSKREKGVSIRFGDAERSILQYLEENQNITLSIAQQLLKTSKRKTSTLLVLLTRAGLLNIHPGPKGDLFTLSKKAFEA